MLINISVRTCIILFMVCAFLLVDTLQIAFLHDLPILITCNIIYLISALLLWWYMTCYLVVPINTVKKSIEEVAAGNLSIHISEFGNNLIACRRIFPRWYVKSDPLRKRQ